MGVFDGAYPRSKTRRGRVINNGQICPTLTVQNQEVYRLVEYKGYSIGIRKLTPKECWRLMGWGQKDKDNTWHDDEFCRAEKVNSNTQLYKQAGNGIVCNVIAAIIGNLFEVEMK